MNYTFDMFGTISQEKDSKEKRELLPCGEYLFTVKDVTLEDFKGSEKLPPCPACVLTLDLNTDGGEVRTVKDKLYSCEEMSWKIRQLLDSVFSDNAGGALNLMQLVGKSGRLELTHGNGVGKNGNTYSIEQVKKYIKKGTFVPL